MLNGILSRGDSISEIRSRDKIYIPGDAVILRLSTTQGFSSQLSTGHYRAYPSARKSCCCPFWCCCFSRNPGNLLLKESGITSVIIYEVRIFCYNTVILSCCGGGCHIGSWHFGLKLICQVQETLTLQVAIHFHPNYLKILCTVLCDNSPLVKRGRMLSVNPPKCTTLLVYIHSTLTTLITNPNPTPKTYNPDPTRNPSP